MPGYQRAESNASLPLKGLTVEGAQAKAAGSAMVASWRPWLFPEDD